MPRPGPSTVNVDWDADDIPLRYRARDGRIDTTHSENGSVLASVPLPTRQQTRLNLARLIAGQGWTVVPSESATSAAAMQEDLARILGALGLDVIARPYSPHEAVTRDVLPAIERLRATLNGANTRISILKEQNARLHEAEVQPDRPEPVDPASVREGDHVEVAYVGWVDKDGWVRSHDDDTCLLAPIDQAHAKTVRILQRPQPEPDEAAVEALARALYSELRERNDMPVNWSELAADQLKHFRDKARNLIRDHGVNVEVPDA